MSSTPVVKPALPVATLVAKRLTRSTPRRLPRRRRRWTLERIIFTTLNTTFLVALGGLMVYPLLNTLAISLNDGMDAVRGGIGIWPRVFSLRNYEVVLNMDTIYQAFFMSVLKTVVVVATNLFFTSMLAYALSRREFIFRRPITMIFVLTMYFDAGLIPNYLLIRDLGMLNSFHAYWVPVMISAFNLIVLRTYMKSIPDEVTESARIDGAGEFRTWWQIVMPLCRPALAVVGLFVAVGSWNAWLDTLLYNSGEQWLSTLQYELQKLLSSSMNAGANSAANAATVGAGGQLTTPIALRSAITVVAAFPILCVYPFLQKHFVSGLMIGSVKG
jgi:putative aldouronate transport system permease protein